MEGTKPVVMIMEGTRPNAYDYGGHPAASRPALPNLINAVSMLKSKSKPPLPLIPVPPAHAAVGAENFGLRRDKQVQPLHHPRQCGFDFNILTAFIRLGRARPVGAGCPPILYGLRLGRARPAGAGCPPILQGLGRVPSIITGIVPSILFLFDFIIGIWPLRLRTVSSTDAGL